MQQVEFFHKKPHHSQSLDADSYMRESEKNVFIQNFKLCALKKNSWHFHPHSFFYALEYAIINLKILGEFLGVQQ